MGVLVVWVAGVVTLVLIGLGFMWWSRWRRVLIRLDMVSVSGVARRTVGGWKVREVALIADGQQHEIPVDGTLRIAGRRVVWVQVL